MANRNWTLLLLLCHVLIHTLLVKAEKSEPALETENEYHDELNAHAYSIPRYLWYQNQPYNNQPGFVNEYNRGYQQCPVRVTPPNPKSGCCGIDLSDGDRVTDLEDFLQMKALSSTLGSLFNYPRNSFSRIRRQADFDDVDIVLDDRIAGGREADLDQFPWIAYLEIQFTNGNNVTYFSCGGSLISSNYILTAAHCLSHDEDVLTKVDVVLAEYDKRTFPRDCVMGGGRKQVCIDNVLIPAETAIIHPNYNRQFLINDIALLKLQRPAPYTKSIRPICLPEINIDTPKFANLPLATAGWGLNVSVESDVKQFTTIHMVPKRECSAYYPRLTDAHLCASGKVRQDTCKGDSGGPLMMMYQGIYYLVGIVSGKTSAAQCGTPIPSLYANVYTYLDWIRYNIK